MTTYVMLLNWTEQGAKTLRESPKRLDAARKSLEEMGGSIREFYLIMGEADLMAVCEAPDDAVMARFTLALDMGGYVRSRTMKAFPETAYRELIGSLR